MGWIRTQQCTVGVACRLLRNKIGELATPCYGAIEADHLGERAMGQKADDRTTAPLCAQHHLERTSFSGFFKNWTREGMREWTVEEIAFWQGQHERWSRKNG